MDTLLLNDNVIDPDKGLSALNVVLIFCAFVLALVFVAFVKKLVYRFKYKKRYYIIPRVGVKGISNIAMVISISIAVILLLTVVTAGMASVIFRTWAGTRVTLEGILIKIGGLLFGPIIGIFIGAMTDLLAVALTAGVFHYGYLFAAMAFGLVGGVIRNIMTYSNQKDTVFAFYSTILTALVGAGVCIFLFYLGPKPYYSIPIFGHDIRIDRTVVIGIIAGFIAVSISIIWICLFVQRYQNRRILPKKRQFKPNQKEYDWYRVFAPVLTTVLITEVAINVFMMPSFDASLTGLQYSQWVSLRIAALIPMVVLNMLVIYPVFKIVVPLVTYNYEDELVEDLNVPLYVD